MAYELQEVILCHLQTKNTLFFIVKSVSKMCYESSLFRKRGSKNKAMDHSAKRVAWSGRDSVKDGMECVCGDQHR